MTKYDAVLRLADEPMKIIKWFTNNFDKEIGALGIGEMRDGELCVDRLVFPKQTVNGVHVHFKPSDWAPIIQELTPDEISKIIFYWHKHPGSAGASQGDEEDTFDVFMGEEAERPFFGFLQTAKKTNGNMDYEARIEMRTPIWASITNVKLYCDSDYDIEEVCEKIIEERISYGNAGATDQPGANKEIKTVTNQTGSYEYDFDDYESFMDVKKVSGAIVIEASIYYEEMILSMLSDPKVENTYKKVHNTYPKNNMVKIIVQPVKGKIGPLFKYLKKYSKELFYTDTEEEIKDLASQYEHYNEDVDIKESNRIALAKSMYNHNINNYTGCYR